MKPTNAAASWRDWQKAIKTQLLKDVSRIENLFTSIGPAWTGPRSPAW